MTSANMGEITLGRPNTPLPFENPPQNFAGPGVAPDARTVIIDVLTEWRLKPNDLQLQSLVHRIGVEQVRKVVPTFTHFALLTLSTGDREFMVYYGKEVKSFADPSLLADWLAEKQRKGS
jgi:hypothetical protein